MMRDTDDLCSTVSTLSSTWTEFDQDDGGAEGEEDEVEMKYVPPESPPGEDVAVPRSVRDKVKTEVDEDYSDGEDEVNEEVTGRTRRRRGRQEEDSEEKSDDEEGTSKRQSGMTEERKKRCREAMRRYRERKRQGKTTPGGRPRRNTTVGLTVSSGDENETFGDLEEDEGDNSDKDWEPEEEDAKVKKRKGAGGGARKKRGGKSGGGSNRRQSQVQGGGPRKRKTFADMTPEEREKERQRARDYRLRMKMLKMELAREEAGGGSDQKDVQSQQEANVKVESEVEKEEETGGPTKRKRLRIAEMSPEAAAKERARLRARKDAERELKNQLKESLKEEEDDKIRKEISEIGITLGGRRKKISEMTEEEKERMRKMWKEQAQRRRERRRSMPNKQATDYEKQRNLRKKEKRKLAKEGLLPPEELERLEEARRRDRERRKRIRENMTEEEKREVVQKNFISRAMRLAAMTDEEKEQKKQRSYFQYQAKLAAMTEEEKQALREKNRQKRLLAPKPAMTSYQRRVKRYGREAVKEMDRKAWREMDPDKKEKVLESYRECYRRRVAKLKQDPEKWAEVQKKWNERDRENKSRRRVRQGLKPIKPGKPRGPKKPKPETEEEIEAEKQRQAHLRRVWDKKYRLKKKLELFQKLLDSGMSIEEIQQQTDTNKQRERRCIRRRIRKAKNRLQFSLQWSGATPEEIAKQVEEVEKTYDVSKPVRPYKPLAENRKPIDPEEIAKLKSEIEKLDKIAEQVVKGEVAVTPTTSVKKTPPTTPRPSATVGVVGPRKRGRPPKKQVSPTTQQVQTQNAVPHSVITQATPAVGASTLTQHGQMHGYPSQQYVSTYSTPHNFSYGHHATPQQGPSSLQYALESINYQNSATSGAPAQQSYPESSYEPSVASSSYFDDDQPLSPGGNYEDSYNQQQSGYPQNQFSGQQEPKPEPVTPSHSYPVGYHQQQQQQFLSTLPSTRATRAPRQPRDASRPKTVYKKRTHVLKGPNDRLRRNQPDEKRTCICEICGGAYSRENIRQHTILNHHPSYDRVNKTCKVCGQIFTWGQKWHKHYLDVHVRPNKPAKEKQFICEHCGKACVTVDTYKHHIYYQHGDGLKKENFIKCELCTEERTFKQKITYYNHLKRFHPAHQRGGHDCFRCNKHFETDRLLREHVGDAHPESYFPCPYCRVCRFTRLGLHFHYGRCTKLDMPEKERLYKEWTGPFFSVDKWPIPCEFCGFKVSLNNMDRHYKRVHNVIEDQFTCEICKKQFKKRAFWVNHLEEQHCKSMEEMEGYVNKLNCENREGMSVEPLPKKGGRKKGSGTKGAAKRGTGRKVGRPKKAENQSKGGRGRKKKVEEEEWTEESEEEEEMEVNPPKKKKRRKIRVICEEDEMEAESQKKKEEEMREYPEIKVEVPEEQPLEDEMYSD